MIRASVPADVPALHALIRALARYEKLEHAHVGSAAQLGDHLFGARRYCEALVADDDAPGGKGVVGFALFFHNYSTFLGQPGIYLEDLYVMPHFRGHGFGKRLLAHLATLAVERGCGRFEWSVLDWNAPAIGFYKKLGAQPMDDWTIFRVTGDALQRLARA